MTRLAAPLIGLAMLTSGLFAGGQPEKPKPKAEAESRPTASQPAAVPRTLRPPEQAEIIENLLRNRETSSLILPQQPDSAGPPVPASQPGVGGKGSALLVEGTMLVERPGRLVWDEGRPMFVFVADGETMQARTIELLPSNLLEAMEREVRLGATEFVVSAEVTRYHDRNFLLLRKLLRRVEHGNLGP